MKRLAKKIISKLVPKRLKKLIVYREAYSSIASAFITDFMRYISFSRDIGIKDRYKIRASIIAHYHVLEKGLAMPHRRRVFGLEVYDSLRDLLREWDYNSYGYDKQILSAYAVLARVDEARNEEVTAEEINSKVKFLKKGSADQPVGGVFYLTGEEVKKKATGDFKSLLDARRSIRNFSSEPVHETLIQRAVEMAQLSPSVCNRQSTSVVCIINQNLIVQLLSMQNGNRGFGQLIKCLLVVSANIKAFQGANERNQGWIDGGLFSMTLLYSLSYLGLVSCPLNWCVNEAKTRQLRELLSLEESLTPIMLIGVGHPCDHFPVPVSSRFPLEEVYRCIK